MQMHNYVRVDFVINWLSWKPDTHNKPLSTTPAHMTDVYTVCLGVLFLHPHNITMVLYIMSMQINIYIYIYKNVIVVGSFIFLFVVFANTVVNKHCSPVLMRLNSFLLHPI